MRPYDLLIRLQKRRLDEARGPLNEIARRADQVHRTGEQLRAQIAREPEVVRQDPSLALELGPFLTAARAKTLALEAQARELEAARERELAALQRERAELRRLELLHERARQRAERAHDRQSERELADLVLARRASRCSDDA